MVAAASDLRGWRRIGFPPGERANSRLAKARSANGEKPATENSDRRWCARMPNRPLTCWFRPRGEERWLFGVRETRAAGQRSMRNSGRAY
jgi:hypothetical protein